jgi:ubiquinone/menaquinone biosynthesis C-methylase UbiE
MEDAEYDRMAQAEHTHWWYAATRALLAQELRPSLAPCGRVLDAGGGTGATGSWMAGTATVVAHDLVPAAVATYRRRHPAVTAGVASDITRLPFADASFDAVLCVTVLYHAAIPDPAAAVGELVRVTRPGGVVCLFEPGVRRLRRAHDRVTHAARRFSLADLRCLATDAGLHVERATGAHSYLVPPAAIKAVIERGRSASDLSNNEDGLGGVLARAAAAERALLRRVSLPAGLSVMVIARRPPVGGSAAQPPARTA